MGNEPLRQPAVAGRFYPGTEQELKREVTGYLSTDHDPERAVGAVMPHAGYIYSGSVAGETTAAITIPREVIVLGPNHTGLGASVSVFPGGSWRMPFGDVPVNGSIARQIIDESELPVPDEMAHAREHSLEVILPFLYYGGSEDLSFVPITLSMISRDECRILGETLAKVIAGRDEEILLVSSSDMTHYEDHDSAKAKDSDAISRILDMDPDGLIEVVSRRRITMCGIIPTAVMLYAAIDLGATKARLVRYATSGEVSGDYDKVVGYAGIIVN
jgi:AmmeMemoRadiSam system protein B